MRGDPLLGGDNECNERLDRGRSPPRRRMRGENGNDAWKGINSSSRLPGSRNGRFEGTLLFSCIYFFFSSPAILISFT